ncbi:MAG: molybdenum cofactor biosynthesis protein MoaE [Planctomycetaceae bacterium]
MIELTRHHIDTTAVTDSVRSHQAGAVVLFLGTVREFTGSAQTSSLEYEAYPAMAEQALIRLEAEARERWPLVDVRIVHRIGHLELGEVAVAVAVSSAHRQPAFEAGQWLIDTLKERVPIWKKEQYADGQTEWVHPTQKSPPLSAAPDSASSTSNPAETRS